MYAYHEAVVEANDDGVGDGDGGELEVAEVPREGLRDDVHAVGDDAAEDGRRHDDPQLPRLLPHPPPEIAGARRRHLPLLLPHVRVQQRHPGRVLLVPSLLVRGHRIDRIKALPLSLCVSPGDGRGEASSAKFGVQMFVGGGGTPVCRPGFLSLRIGP